MKRSSQGHKEQSLPREAQHINNEMVKKNANRNISNSKRTIEAYFFLSEIEGMFGLYLANAMHHFRKNNNTQHTKNEQMKMKKRNSPLRTRHGRSDRERKAWNHFRAIFGTLNQFELNNKKKIQCRILFCFVENSILKPNSVEFGQMHYTASIYISLSECECVAVRSNDGQLVCGWLVLRKSDHFSLVFHIFTWFMHGWLLIWLKFLKLRDYAYVETDETKPRRYPPICVCVCVEAQADWAWVCVWFNSLCLGSVWMFTNL